ncbi:MAG: GspE/PulE/PilB domain-containing protein [Ktedonobacteraceae bacterium]
MGKRSCTMGTIQDSAEQVRGNLIPRLFVLRRVQMRYYHTLPLSIMKKFQCIVVGSAPGVLTVAITNRQNTTAIEYLKNLTGLSIFPVLIDPTNLRLLIHRIARDEYRMNAFHLKGLGKIRKSGYFQYSILNLQVCSIMILFSIQRAKRM